MEELITATEDQIKEVFTEWERRCREDPESFEKAADSTPEEYGEACAPFFVKLLNEIKGG